jgi:crotonobetainyl-CoA:carnitine CoA-transferase CaiB-like acyl-CoA transferase
VTRSVVAKRVSSLDHQTAPERCAKSGLPASLIYSIADIFEDAQYRARGNTKMTDARVSPLAVDAVPRLRAPPGKSAGLAKVWAPTMTRYSKTSSALKTGEISKLQLKGCLA